VQAGTVHGGVHVHQPSLPAVRPRQLPRTPVHFVNRTREIADLTRIMVSGQGESQSAAIGVIDGTAGVGKSALVIHWAHQVRDRFPDGQVYINLRGFDPQCVPLTPSEALHALLESMGVPSQEIPVTVDGRAALLRGLFSDRRMLLVLDNAADSEHVDMLLPGDPGCVTLVTSRNRLDGVIVRYGAQRFALDIFTPQEARSLFARRLDAQRLAAEHEAAEVLTASCGYLPLALSILESDPLFAVCRGGRSNRPVTGQADSRTTRVGSKMTEEAGRPGCPMWASSMRAISAAISSTGWRTVVSEGRLAKATLLSSKPTTATS
jgi:hypothetical protein